MMTGSLGLRRTQRLRLRSDLIGTLASLFSPFWCLDAKGGEVALLGSSRVFAWVGHKLLVVLFGFYKLVPMYPSYYPLNFMCGVRHATCDDLLLCFYFTLLFSSMLISRGSSSPL